MYRTDSNLQSAFAEESQAICRYVLFADRAQSEGYPRVARLFRALAEAEMIHARNHFNALDGVGSTRDNLLAGIIIENSEFTRSYPVSIRQAKEEDNQRARIAFEYANQTEKVHHQRLEKALESVKAGKKDADEPCFVCQVCGNITDDMTAETCSVCGNVNQFKRVA